MDRLGGEGTQGKETGVILCEVWQTKCRKLGTPFPVRPWDPSHTETVQKTPFSRVIC